MRIVLKLFACFALAGLLAACDDDSSNVQQQGQQAAPATIIHATAYSGNEVVKIFEGTDIDVGHNRVYLYPRGQDWRYGQMASGTVIVERGDTSQSSGTYDYRATLYGVNKVLGTWNVASYGGSDKSNLKLTLPGQKAWSVMIEGTMVLQRINAVPGPDSLAKYKLTLRDGGGNVVGTWMAEEFDSRGGGKLYVKLPGLSLDDLCISGDITMERIN